MRSALILFVFAVVLMATGVYAYLSAPPEAAAATALAIPGMAALLMVLVGALTLAASTKGNLPVARRLHILGLILALAFAAAFTWRARQASEGERAHEAAVVEFERMVEAGEAEDTPEARLAHFEAHGAPVYSRRYLVNTLWILTAFSGAAFLALLFTRPGGTEGLPGDEKLTDDTEQPPPEKPAV